MSATTTAGWLLFGLVCVCGATIEFEDGGEHFEPMVAMLCPEPGSVNSEKYYNKYLSESGAWLTDTDPTATCVQDPGAVLDYCKQVYPHRHITNIVEANHYIKLGSWCTVGSTRCIGNSNWVRPFRCLEGPFQSDALLVPEQCQFDHIHNQSQCRTFNEWNNTAIDTCRGREMILRSFAILLPCGVDLFSGVEFVCCPTSVKQLIKASYGQETLDNEQDEDYYADEEDTYYSDQQFTEMPTTESTTTKKVETTTQDPYLTHYLPRSEHQDYKKAEIRFEEKHKERVSKLMKEWTNIQADFKQTNNQDPEEVKLKMATKYQTSLKELEDLHQAERRQLVAMHQQRVMSRFEERKAESLHCYTQALSKPSQNVHRIRKCLEKVLKALHKERQHSIAQFERLLASSVEAALQEKEATVLHLAGIDLSIKENFDRLNEYPLLKEKVAPLMQDYLIALRTKDSTAASSLFMDKQAERDMLDALVKRRVSANNVELANSDQDGAGKDNKKENSDIQQSVGEIKVEVHATAIHDNNNNAVNNNNNQQPNEQNMEKARFSPYQQAQVRFMDRPSIQDEPSASHVQSNVISHSASYTMRHTKSSEHNSLYVVSMLGSGIMVVAVIGFILRRRGNHEEMSHQGFIQVDTDGSPEEAEVSNMQMTGYENPTYKYFETTSA